MTSLFERERGEELTATECWELLSQAIMPENPQVEELLAAGVAQHTVESLYPAVSLNEFGKVLYVEIEQQDAIHLRAARISSRNWDRIVAITKRLRTALQENGDGFTDEIIDFDEKPIGEIVYQQLYRWHSPDQASDFTEAYIEALCITYWLAIHTVLLARLNWNEANECAQWVVNWLLPVRGEE